MPHICSDRAEAVGRPHRHVPDTEPLHEAVQMSDVPASVSDVEQKELNSDQVANAMRTLRAVYPDLHGLQDPGYGQCVSGHSLPRFEAVTSPFVQVWLSHLQ